MTRTEPYMWINDILKTIEENPTDEAIKRLENCGKCCATRSGFIGSMTKLKELAKDCITRSDYARFLNDHLPPETKCVEVEDGIELHLGKNQCGCPMYPAVQSPALCNCTKGSNKATWSEFFGREVESEIVESHLRGGKDCVLKFFV